MPDKLTDEQIVKALNTALGMEHISVYCANIKKEVHTVKVLDIIDLINRLQAENERLRKALAVDDYILKEIVYDEKTYTFVTNDVSERLKIKTESYTAFAESLKKDFDNPNIQKYGLDFVKFLKKLVDNKLQEMKGND